MINLGQRLRQERISKGYSIDDIVKATKIRHSFIVAIERGDYQKLPSPTYAQGFVKNYASYLNLPHREVMALFRREFDEKHMFSVLPQGLTKQGLPLTFRIHHKAIVVVVLFLLTLIFALYQFRYAFINPPLKIISPVDNFVSKSSDIRVSGHTDSQAIVAINGVSVIVDKNGNFEKNLNVFSGKTTIVISAKHRLGKETKEERIVTVE